ncbi:transcription-repair coupling factor [Thioalkalivibrio sp. HK1]|uniref:transcription-repair coupling factor n=1 Tax=Thioalkalivibrio sp. HK1 TaxID=1469245 RepID=UPI000470466F|nr:transcription-repair coupling factor [Thioalkalivibrio sp. HK1]
MAADLSPLDPALPAAGSKVRWSSLYGSARGLALARLVRKADAPVLVIAPDSGAAHRIESELAFYLDAPDPETMRLESDGDRSADAADILRFPDWETLPYDLFSPHQGIVSERLATLARLPSLTTGVLVSPITTLMGRIAPSSFVDGYRFRIACGDTLEIDTFRRRLERAGYACTNQVMEHGEYAVRGALFDLFPMGENDPLRIDLLDDEVESIRIFDPETQRSESRIDRIDILPAHEFPTVPEAVARFRQAWRRRFEGDPSKCPVYREVSQGGWPAGIEYYLPLFFDDVATVFDFLSPKTVVVVAEGVHEAAEAFQRDTKERWENRRHDPERPILDPEELFLRTEEIFARIAPHPGIHLRIADEGKASGRTISFATRAPTALPVDGRAERPMKLLQDFLEDFSGRTLIVAETPGRREILLESLAGHDLRPTPVEGFGAFIDGDASLAIAVSPLEDGARIEEPRLEIIAESQLFGTRAAQQQRRRRGARRDPEGIVRDLSELHLGAPVVHEAHGIGRYAGLTVLEVAGGEEEFLQIEYAEGDRLYVPVASVHLVSRFTGIDPEAAPLHRLGSKQWERARRRAAEKVVDVAAELLDVQARRAGRPGIPFTADPGALQEFEAAFPFDETADQSGAIAQVFADMSRPSPMDRLVCGDVGFGKTEVAMRAAFVCAHAGKQVAVLVPTTLLAQQHQQTFQDRFADWPVQIRQISRFSGKEAQADVLRGLAEGTVDIVIGTHKLLGNGIRFKRLGLVIIDEEHRFGVRQKERLKALRSEVDVLTLTATPIPRTLDMALSGLRDLSLIATPPAKRLSIQTFVREWDPQLLREAFQRELRRGGQIFFVHNKVDTIERVASDVRELLEGVEVRVAHGQMRERDLERIMLDFYHRRFQVLVCTTIIETGIDIPNANTIVINRADRFGLAQLHQLRGRVGRSHHRAYAYLIVPERSMISRDALRRLNAIESLGDLGVGFTLATHDLEIRGAGELLGSEQSGQIQEVGYSLYTRLLERAVEDLRAGRSPELDRPLDTGAEIDLREPALIPQDYLHDVHTRLIMYKRIAGARDRQALEEVMVETIDRFGPLPGPARLLFDITGLKLRAAPFGIRKIEVGDSGGRIIFHSQPSIDPACVIGLVQREPARFRLDGPDKLRFFGDYPDAADKIAAVERILGDFSLREAA